MVLPMCVPQIVASFSNTQLKTKAFCFKSVFALYMHRKACVAYVRIYFLFFILGYFKKFN